MPSEKLFKLSRPKKIKVYKTLTLGSVDSPRPAAPTSIVDLFQNETNTYHIALLKPSPIFSAQQKNFQNCSFHAKLTCQSCEAAAFWYSETKLEKS